MITAEAYADRVRAEAARIAPGVRSALGAIDAPDFTDVVTDHLDGDAGALLFRRDMPDAERRAVEGTVLAHSAHRAAAYERWRDTAAADDFDTDQDADLDRFVGLVALYAYTADVIAALRALGVTDPDEDSGDDGDDGDG